MSRKLPLGRLTAEFFVIVVGVLVALGVDQWMESQDNRALVEETLRALAAEIAENGAILENRLAYHTRVLPTLDSLRTVVEAGRRITVSISEALPEGLQTSPLRATAWDLASVTESARHFDLPLLSFLATTYSVQEALLDRDRIVNSGVIQPQWFGATDQTGPVIFLAVVLADIRDQEGVLQRFYAESLRLIRERLGDPEAGAAIRIS